MKTWRVSVRGRSGNNFSRGFDEKSKAIQFMAKTLKDNRAVKNILRNGRVIPAKLTFEMQQEAERIKNKISN